MFGLQIDICCRAVTTIVDPTLDTWLISWSYYIIVTSQGWQQDGGSSMCSCSAGRAADPPPTTALRACRGPHPSQERGGLGGGKRIKKVNTSVLELVCLVTEQGKQQIFSFQAGQPGGSSRNQISSSKYEPVCTCLYSPQTLMYSDIQVCTCMYRHVPCCTSLYRLVLRIPVLVCTGMYWYVLS